MLLHSPAKFLEYAQRRLMTQRKGMKKVYFFLFFALTLMPVKAAGLKEKKNVFLQLQLGIRQA